MQGVYKVKTNEDCRRVIDEIYNGKAKTSTIKEFKIFLMGLEKICFNRKNEEELYSKYYEYMSKG